MIIRFKGAVFLKIPKTIYCADFCLQGSGFTRVWGVVRRAVALDPLLELGG